MIKILKYPDVDWGKYNTCLRQSVQYKVYAEQKYLALVGESCWEFLVEDDYQAVMPVFFQKIYGRKLVRRPMIIQQLGVFSREDDSQRNGRFLNFLQKKYAVEYYPFNDANQLEAPLLVRKNYILPQRDYAQTYAAYSPKRKRKLRLNDDVKNDCHMAFLDDFDVAKAFIETHLIGYKSRSTQKYGQEMAKLHQKGLLEMRAFYYKNEIINLNVLLKMPQAVILIGTFNHAEHMKINGASVLVDWAIRDHIAERLFDFEGSDLPNIEAFFTGFRPALKPYPVLQHSKISILKQVFCGLFK
jgi:hypothetical protein